MGNESKIHLRAGKGVGALQWAVPVGVFGDAACSLLPLGTLLGSCRAEKLGSSPSKHGETWSGGHLSAREAAGTAATSGAAAPPRARLRTDHSLFAWRGVLNLKELTQGFWSGDELGYHIIHLELDPVFPEGTEREDGVVEAAQKLRECGATATVVAPHWSGQPWFRELEALVSDVAFLPRRRDPFTPSRLGWSTLHGTQSCLASPAARESHFAEEQGSSPVGNMRHVAYEYGSDEDLDLRRETYSTLLPLRSEGEPAEGLPWLPAVEEAVLPCPGSLPRRGTALAGSMQPHLSAINDYHEDLGFDGPAEGRPVVRVLKGRASIQAQVLADAGQQESERTWLPAEAVARVHGVVLGHSWGTDRDRLHLLRACVYSVVASCTFGRPEAGAGLQQQDVAASPEHIIFVLRRGKRGQQVRTKRGLVVPLQATVSGGSLGGAVLIGRGTWGRLAEAGPRGNFLYASGKPRGRAQYADPVHEVWILNGCGHDDAVSLMGSLDGETRGSPQHTNRGRRHADSRGLEGKRLEAASGKKTADPSLER
eukprot:gene10244-biopygen10475